ncbi:MAG: DNA polymerase I [Oscillospiraceae bacterium]|nr:DNA polymerase I [Oscillospiraceae bacterium]
MKLLILDGNSVINRAFYGVHLLTTRDGEYTNAIYGFLNILEKLRQDEKPDALCVAFDRKEPTFRHEMYDGYKATRHPMPEELAAQMPVMKDVLRAMNVPMFECAGWEADDILGTVSRICAERGWHCVVATGDRDSLQLVNDSTTVRLSVNEGRQTIWRAYTPDVFTQEYGFAPKRIIDLKALMGDSSDNIPGVAGVGPKTATDLLLKFGSFEDVYASIDDPKIRETLRTKLKNCEDAARLSYDLATIRCNAPITFSPEDCLIREPDNDALYALFRRLEFAKLMGRYGLHAPAPELSAQDPAEEARVITDPEEALALLQTYRAGTVVVDASDDLETLTVLCGDTVSEFPSGLSNFSEVRKIIFSKEVSKVAHDCKPLMRKLLANGLTAEGFVFDTAVAAYLLDATRGHYELEQLCARYLKKDAPQTAAQRCRAAAELWSAFLPLLEQEGLFKLYETVELPLCAVLAEMEHEGIAVDRFALLSFEGMLTERIGGCQKRIFELAGHEFNIQSPKQLGTVLFEEMGIRPAKKTKSGYATGAEILEKLRPEHPIISDVLDYRMLTKLRSTYAEGLTKCIEEDGRIRTTFQNTVTATGRLSSTDPNLQNIPVRTEMGAEIRKMFVPRDGWLFVDADYSQIELRVLAHIADDAAMQEAFNSGEDFHTATAAQVFGVALGDVTPQMRRSAKAVNFGIVYGISEFSLAQDIGVSRAEAKRYIDTYLARFSGVGAYMRDIVAQAHATGSVRTLFGRKREIPELKEKNFMLRSAGERIALNTPIQGTAADIMKIATIRTARALREAGLKARLVLQVHDELIAECPAAEAERVKEILTREMEQAALLKAPLKVEAHDGESWYAAK